jgi:hypothetical protein
VEVSVSTGHQGGAVGSPMSSSTGTVKDAFGSAGKRGWTKLRNASKDFFDEKERRGQRRVRQSVFQKIISGKYYTIREKNTLVEEMTTLISGRTSRQN